MSKDKLDKAIEAFEKHYDETGINIIRFMRNGKMYQFSFLIEPYE